MVRLSYIKTFLAACSMALAACGGNSDDVLASVGSATLYRNDLEGLIQKGLSRKDSIERAKDYIESWTRREIVLQKANEEMKGSMEEIDRQVASFKQDLILAQYEQQYLAKHLDTTITEDHINLFYSKNQSMFELRDYVVDVFYLKFDAGEKDIDRIGTEVRKCPDAASAAELDKKYGVMASNSYYEPGSWLFLNDLLREIPIEIEDKARFLENNPYLEVRTDEFVYLVRIFEYKLRNDTAPLKLVKDKIKTLILRRRSKELLTRMRTGLVEKYKNENEN